LKQSVVVIAGLAVLSLAVGAHARDLGVLVLPVHEGKFTSSLLYEKLKVREDFGTRGEADFTSDVAGAQFSYGLTDRISVALKGGVLIDPEEDAQGSQWQSRAGYLYGIDLYNEVFPATAALIPGIQLSAGVTGFQVPFDRLNSGGTVTLIDQKLSGVEYHGAVLGTWKWMKLAPYAGIKGFGSTVDWHDNQPTGGNPANITGHASGNVSLVVGLPIQLTPDLRLQAEGKFLNGTTVTTGFTVAVF
jgi:hypothetical protein